MLLIKFFKIASILSILAFVQSKEEQIYRMCVPKMFYRDCLNLLKDPTLDGLGIECVKGRDRIGCLDMINQRKADVLALEPEDVYVAYHTKNADYRIISEIRTQDNKYEDFHYEGIILVKKKSHFYSLKDLRGAKSCHTGFGRDAGFKIPVTKLKNLHILKVSLNPDLIAPERELKALSEFFSQSCLVGTYSPYPETDRLWKKKYHNLCALCENLEQCDYPDLYSGFDGSIRCLDKGRGEVAFTKVLFVNKYFGMIPGTTAEGDPAEFDYLCEDGTRRPINGLACSWGQRPWSGYISNVDAVSNNEKLLNLQYRLKKFFEVTLHNHFIASHLLINRNSVYYSKPTAEDPKEYLEKAGYTDVIERDGFANRIMKMCIQTDIEMKKCDDMRRAAYSRDIRPEIECLQDQDCILAVRDGKADLLAVRAKNYKDARVSKLNPIIYENYGPDNVHVAVVDTALSKNDIENMFIHYDGQNQRAEKAAAFLNKLRGINTCKTTPVPEKNIMIVNSKDLKQFQNKNKQLLCSNLEKKPINEYMNCNLETNLPVAIFVAQSMTFAEQEIIKHLFYSLSKKFGKARYSSDVFTLFGEYEENAKNVLFDDDAVEFSTELKNSNTNEEIYNSLSCDVIALVKESMTPEQQETIKGIYEIFSDIFGKTGRLEITQE